MKLMKRRRSAKNRSVIVTWLISDCLLVFIPLLCTLAVSVQYSRTLYNQTNQFNRYVSESISGSAERVLGDMRAVYKDIVYNPSLQPLLAIQNPDAYYSDSSYYAFLNWLSTYSAYKKGFDFLSIYLPETDMVLSEAGIVDSQGFYAAYLNDSGMSYDLWKQSMTASVPDNTVINLAANFNVPQDTVTYHFPISKSQTGGHSATVSFYAGRDRFFEGLQDVAWSDMCSVYLFDDAGRLLISSGRNQDDLVQAVTMNDLLRASDGETVVKKDIFIDTVHMNVVTVSPKRAVFREVWSMRTFTVLIFCLGVLVSAVQISFLLRKNYLSIKNLLRRLNINTKSDEYAAIQKAIEQHIQRSEQLMDTCEEQAGRLKRFMLGRILVADYVNDFLESNMERYGIRFSFEFFAVLLFRTDQVRELNGDSDPANIHTELSFILQNVFEELFNMDGMQGYVLELNNQFVCLVNLDETQEDAVWDKAEYGVRFINQYFGTELSFAVSDLHQGMEQVSAAYGEGQRVMEYMKLLDLGCSMRFNELKTGMEDRNGFFRFEKEKELINSIKSGDCETASDLVNAFFQSLASEKLTLEQTKCIILDVATTMMKIPMELGMKESDLAGCLDPQQILNLSSNTERMRQYILRAAEQICAYVQDGNVGKQTQFCTKVQEYVYQHYSDPNLNVSAIAAEFRIVPSYLSKLFKAESGEQLTDFICQVRLEKTKELIRENRETLNSIASMVGFGHIRTFNRVFKKYEGITPSAYSRLHQN